MGERFGFGADGQCEENAAPWALRNCDEVERQEPEYEYVDISEAHVRQQRYSARAPAMNISHFFLGLSLAKKLLRRFAMTMARLVCSSWYEHS